MAPDAAWESGGGRSRRRAAAVVAGLAVVAAVVVLWPGAGEPGEQGDRGGEGPERIAVVPTDEAAPERAAERAQAEARDGGFDGRAEGRLEPLGEAPVAGRMHAEAVWTGEELVVWGGMGTIAPEDRAGHVRADHPEGRWQPLGDGARWDPEADAWEAIPEAPGGVGGAHAVAAWTGEELLAWGPTPGGEAMAGAAFDLAAETWRELPDAPLPADRDAVAAWTGDELWVVAGVPDEPGRHPAAAYDPAADAWRDLPELATTGDGRLVGGLPHVAEGLTAPRWAVWAADRLVVVDHGAQAWLASGGDAWQVRPIDVAASVGAAEARLYAPVRLERPAVVGDEVVAQLRAPARLAEERGRQGAALLRLSHGGAPAVVPGPPSVAANTTDALTATDEGLVLLLDPVNTRGWAAWWRRGQGWLRLPDELSEHGQASAVAWTGEELVVWGGYPSGEGGQGPAEARADGLRWRPGG